MAQQTAGGGVIRARRAGKKIQDGLDGCDAAASAFDCRCPAAGAARMTPGLPACCPAWTERAKAELLAQAKILLWDVKAAQRILVKAGFPMDKAPFQAADAGEYWEDVFWKLNMGVKRDGHLRVLDAMLEEFPARQELLNIRARLFDPRRFLELEAFVANTLTHFIVDGLAGRLGLPWETPPGMSREEWHRELRAAVARKLYSEDLALARAAEALGEENGIGPERVEIANRLVPFKDIIPPDSAAGIAPLLKAGCRLDADGGPAPGLRAKFCPDLSPRPHPVRSRD